MPRKPRIDYGEQYYHVVARGTMRQTLFYEDGDFLFYLDLLRDNKKKFNILINHYTLMPNHIHLVLYSHEDMTLQKLFHAQQRAFSSWFKKRHAKTGPTWENRYWNSIIYDESYLLACGRYVELNPVRAGIANFAWDYKWSSASYYLKGTPNNIITPDPTYLDLGHSDQERRKAYADFLDQAMYAVKPRGDLAWSFWNRPSIGNKKKTG